MARVACVCGRASSGDSQRCGPGGGAAVCRAVARRPMEHNNAPPQYTFAASLPLHARPLCPQLHAGTCTRTRATAQAHAPLTSSLRHKSAARPPSFQRLGWVSPPLPYASVGALPRPPQAHAASAAVARLRGRRLDHVCVCPLAVRVRRPCQHPLRLRRAPSPSIDSPPPEASAGRTASAEGRPAPRPAPRPARAPGLARVARRAVLGGVFLLDALHRHHGRQVPASDLRRRRLVIEGVVVVGSTRVVGVLPEELAAAVVGVVRVARV